MIFAALKIKNDEIGIRLPFETVPLYRPMGFLNLNTK